MAGNEPRVTILIANHNYGKYIEEAIESAKNQSFPCSICVVDDCSTDNSQKVITKSLFGKEMTKKQVFGKNEVRTLNVNVAGKQVLYTFVKVGKNLGPSEARNIGIKNTIGNTEFYCVLDSDDRMSPLKVEILLKYAMSNPSVIGVVYGDYDIYNEETGITIREYKEPFSLKRLLSECIVHSGALINKIALEFVKDENGYYDREMRTCEDYDLWIRIARRFIILHVPEPLTLVINQKNNSTYSVDKSIWQKNWNRISEKIRKFNEQQIHSTG